MVIFDSQNTMDQPTHKSDDLQEQLTQVHKELSVLYDISNAMRTTLELNHIMYIILTGVTSHAGLGFNRGILFLVNQQERCLEAKMAIGPESGEQADRIWTYIKESGQKLEDLIAADKLKTVQNTSSLYESVKNLKIPLDNQPNNLLATAFHKGSAVLLRQDEIAAYREDPLLKVFSTRELVIVPLRGKEKILGIIIADNIYTQKPITDDDVKIFIMLANQAGLAIENSQLYEMVVHKSHTDSLCNIWNHGYFQHCLAAEVEKAKNTQTHTSLLMIDIDNFKNLNDTYGHKNGDLVLQGVAELLKHSSRAIDYICRYGGEEFAIILPQTTKEQGLDIAERIRQRIAEQEFGEPKHNEKLKITVSIGLATYPEHTTSKEDLIAKADKAMYIAKFGGKNQVCVAEKEDLM